ncbi:MAG: hypothetical protein G8345_14425 [Magnetococcales bacterium]|nr:hypothetical protein [Magnetococcales bacterium]NGZ28071.1 hypothetical protein [Magnetococcales bacterium]
MAKYFMFPCQSVGKFWPSLFLGVALLASSGCATMMAKAVTNASLVDPSRRYAATTSVQLLRERPREPYKVIGYLETLGNEYVNSEIFLVENMRAKAREIGADAIVVHSKGRTTVRGSDIIQLLEGEAIKF